MNSYASSKVLFASLFLLLQVNGLPGLGQSRPVDPNDISQSSVSDKPSSSDDQVIPKTQDPLPPVLPERVVPAPPVIPGPSLSTSVPYKASLAWRQKAARISQDKQKLMSAGTQSALLRSFDSSYSDCLMALAGACANNGFKVEYINSNAGEILASSADGQQRLVFVVWEKQEGKTWVNAAIDKGGTASMTKTATSILDSTATTISKRGRI
jgi:hypothetical protein